MLTVGRSPVLSALRLCGVAQPEDEAAGAGLRDAAVSGEKVRPQKSRLEAIIRHRHFVEVQWLEVPQSPDAPGIAHAASPREDLKTLLCYGRSISKSSDRTDPP
jgi:hypothetical protein